MSPAVDVSWHPNHFLSDRIMSPLCSALSWPRASWWCSKTRSEWQFTVRRRIGQEVHGKWPRRHGVREFRKILSLTVRCGTGGTNMHYTQMLEKFKRYGTSSDGSVWIADGWSLINWSPLPTESVLQYPPPPWSLKSACCSLITLNISFNSQ